MICVGIGKLLLHKQREYIFIETAVSVYIFWVVPLTCANSLVIVFAIDYRDVVEYYTRIDYGIGL